MYAKEALRAQVLARRSSMTQADRAAAGSALAAALTDALDAATAVAAYVSMGTEPGTAELLRRRPDVLLPVLCHDGDLDWALGGPLVPAAKGLFEPSGPRLGRDAIAGCDLVVVPALAVDLAGNRLGRGGGSYDRALGRTTGLTVALLYDGETVDALQVEPHDVPVQAVATPEGGLRRLHR
jgi:5-formyltetrahydrofolate cyclo-ligase